MIQQMCYEPNTSIINHFSIKYKTGGMYTAQSPLSSMTFHSVIVLEYYLSDNYVELSDLFMSCQIFMMSCQFFMLPYHLFIC